jgi:hypothetical protein
MYDVRLLGIGTIPLYNEHMLIKIRKTNKKQMESSIVKNNMLAVIIFLPLFYQYLAFFL